MSFTDDDLRALAALASEAARRAGEHIRASTPARVERKSSALSPAAQVVTEVDRAAQAILLEVLAPSVARYDLAVLAEEDEDDRARLEKAAFWCVDPLDGTLPYVERHAGYAVSIALVSRAGAPLLGVVYAPEEARLYRAVRGQGALVDDAPLRVRGRAGARTLAVSADPGFDRALQPVLDEAARALGLESAEILGGEGGVLSALRVLERAPGCYFKLPKRRLGGGSLWDFAASACIAREAGGVATDFAGAPLELNRAESTFMNHRGVLYASEPRIAEALRAYVG